MYTHTYTHTHVCMHICLHQSIDLSIYTSMSIYISMRVCTCAPRPFRHRRGEPKLRQRRPIYIYVCVCVYIYIYMYIYIYIYIYIGLTRLHHVPAIRFVRFVTGGFVSVGRVGLCEEKIEEQRWKLHGGGAATRNGSLGKPRPLRTRKGLFICIPCIYICIYSGGATARDGSLGKPRPLRTRGACFGLYKIFFHSKMFVHESII